MFKFIAPMLLVLGGLIIAGPLGGFIAFLMYLAIELLNGKQFKAPQPKKK